MSLAPFIIAVFTDATTVVQYSERSGGWLWGLFGPEYDDNQFQEIKGYLMTTETRHGLLAVIAFYFGQDAAK